MRPLAAAPTQAGTCTAGPHSRALLRAHLLRVAHHRMRRPHRLWHNAFGLLCGGLLRRRGGRRCRCRSVGGGRRRRADGLRLDALAPCRRRRSGSPLLLRLLHCAARSGGCRAGRCGGGGAHSGLVDRGWRLRGGRSRGLGSAHRPRAPGCRRGHRQRLAHALRRRHALGNVRRQLVQRQRGAQLSSLKRGDAVGRQITGQWAAGELE